MHFIKLILLSILLVTFFNEPVMSSWEFAVTTKERISFYGTNWEEITSAAHSFDLPSAIAFDETEEILYFNDLHHKDGSIFSLKLSADGFHRAERLLQKTQDEEIMGMAFDPLDRILYWTDAKNRRIYKLSVDGKIVAPSILLQLNETKIPSGIAIDVCRRQLYWTNSNKESPSIEHIPLNGASESKVLIDTDLYMPSGIVVDQYSKRLYWVDDKNGIRYSVESVKLDGTDRKDIAQRAHNVPLNVAVNETDVFWTDDQNRAVWRLPKNATDEDEPQKLHEFEKEAPRGIIARIHLLSTQKGNPDCKRVLKEIENNLQTMDVSTNARIHSMENEIKTLPEHFCLNGGKLNPTSDRCDCLPEFSGEHCEIKKCHNFCFEGTCHLSSTGIAQCVCHAGFKGKRCEINMCSGFCLNDGRCDLENNEPVCHCDAPFYGERCESLEISEMCNRFCNNERVDASGIDLAKMCNNCAPNDTASIQATAKSNGNQRMGTCDGSVINKTALFVSVGVVVSLLLVAIIVITIRCVYKPLRPRIKKTYVVHKNVTPTPLTCRPTTEQCEITIENCCNMNICDTPCFDPKTLQAEAAKKDDKKMLLNHTDDLMY